jgi:glycosyltransferase involved in cell wall biosynthesis
MEGASCASDPRSTRSIRRTAVFVISADYARGTGGWVYDSRVLSELRRLGWDIRDIIAPAGFPDPDAAAATATARALSSLPDRTLVLSDQLVTSVLPDVMEAEGERLLLVPIVHHPLALEGGREARLAETLADAERRALACARRVIATSAVTARTLAADYGVAAQRLIVAQPGFDRQPASVGSADGQPLQLLAIGSVVPRKDYGTLIAALAGVRDRPWQLTIVGSTSRDPDYVAALQTEIAGAGLADRVRLVGETHDEALDKLWRVADLFVSSSIHEGFGMALGEAITHGLPVVTTAAGAVGDWVDRRAAVVVDVGDADALRAAVARLLDDPGHRRQLRRGAMQARDDLPTWADAANIVDRALAPLLALA